jgi:hypothetical protein
MHLDKNGLNPLKRKREVEKYRKKDRNGKRRKERRSKPDERT